MLQANASTSGVYMLPNMYGYDSSSAESMDDGLFMMKNGPTMFASIQLEGMPRSMKPFLISLLLQIIGAGIVTWMALHTKGLRFGQLVAFVTLFGVGVGVLGVLPAWNWGGISSHYALVLFLDLVIGWFLAGLAIAKICKSK